MAAIIRPARGSRADRQAQAQGVNMNTKRFHPNRTPLKPLAAAVALALAAPAALAEPMFSIPWFREAADMSRYDRNNVELGVGYNSEDSFKFGEYSGLYDQGAFVIGNFNVNKRLGESTANYVQAYGWNLGLPSLQIGAEAGNQGRYWVNGGYQQIHRYQYDDTQFLHRGLGGDRLTLPAGFTGITAGTSQPPSNINAIAPFLTEYDIKQERDIWRLGGGINIGPGLDVSVNYRQDDRDGSRLIGAVMGNTGGNPRAAILPYGLNDSTKQVEAVLNWTGTKGQASFSYWYSKYDQEQNSLSWQNPYGGIAGWGVGAPGFSGTGFPTGFGRLGLMPSNDYWQVQATGGWNFTRDTRMTAAASYGVAKQDEAFLPYTINGPAAPGLPTQTPGTSLAINTPLPSSSLNGEIKNTMFDLGLSSRLMPKLTVRARYHYYDRDNRTPEQWFSYVGGDTTAQTAVPPGIDPETINSSRVRRNLAPGTTENRFKLDGDYEIWRRTLLRLWYQYQKIDYAVASEELRSDTDNNQYAAEVRHFANEYFTGALRYQYDRRRGSDFSNARPYQASYTSAFIATTPFDNLPTLRQYYVADYDQDLVRALGTITPMETVAVSLSADWYKRNYKGPDCGGPNDQTNPALVIPSDCLGLQEARGQSYTLDASWTPVEGLSAFAFYTYGSYENQQNSRSWGGANSPANPARNWGAGLENIDHTFGVGTRFTPADRKWDVGVQYLYNDGRAKTSVSGVVVPVTSAPVPDATSKLNSLQIFGKWRYSKNIAFRANYWYERFSSYDWAYENAAAWTSNNVLLTGQQSPEYSAHVIGFSVAYENW
jgi:MtrB/PioB family decaheme-associated outer membrane protein